MEYPDDWVLFSPLDKKEYFKNVENFKDVKFLYFFRSFQNAIKFYTYFKIVFQKIGIDRRFKKSSFRKTSALIYKVLISVIEFLDFLIHFRSNFMPPFLVSFMKISSFNLFKNFCHGLISLAI